MKASFCVHSIVELLRNVEKLKNVCLQKTNTVLNDLFYNYLEKSYGDILPDIYRYYFDYYCLLYFGLEIINQILAMMQLYN